MTSAQRRVLYLPTPTLDGSPTPAIAQQGWDVHVAADTDGAMQVLRENDFRVGVVHWDGRVDDMSALQRQAERLHEAGSRMNWVALLSGVDEMLDRMSRLISTYFYDYHTVPVDADRLFVTLGHAYGMAAISSGDNCAAAQGQLEEQLVGCSDRMRDLHREIVKVAAIDLNVLIRGESGTGKELTAQAVHRLSSRADGPFVAVNCGALPRDLIQAELFGHEKGAFTGASRQRVGRIEAAQNGTLFLDEIGDLPLELQTNLLRFLQEKTIDRIGNSTEIPVDVRVIAATNVNLEQAVEEGRFREDLYYRLNVLHLDLPPLRARDGDVPLLADHFFQQFARTLRPDVRGFSKQALNAIADYTWPGNVREMVNRIQRAVVMCDGRMIKPRDLGLDREEPPGSTLMTLAQAREKAEKEIIEATLSAVRNNVSKAARRLDISRVTLYRLMEVHAIDWQSKKSA